MAGIILKCLFYTVFQSFSMGLSHLCGKGFPSFIAFLLSPMSTSIYSLILSTYTTCPQSFALAAGSRGIQTKMIINIWYLPACICNFFSEERIHSLSQILKGVCESSQKIKNNNKKKIKNTVNIFFFTPLKIFFSLSRWNSLLSQSSQHYPLAIKPIYIKRKS